MPKISKIIITISIIFYFQIDYCFAKEQLFSWHRIPKISLGKQIKVYWNVLDSTHGMNSKIAKEHGFFGVSLLGTFSDYQHNQKYNIAKWIPDNYSNPWEKPTFFESTVRRNINDMHPDDIYVHDIEVKFQSNLGQAWLDYNNLSAANIHTFETFKESYFQAMSEWFYLPLLWTKQKYPNSKIGLYGIQPFRRDYWGIIGKSHLEIDGAHAYDINLWKYIEPYVDFHVASVYLFYENPDSYYYLMSNIENNYLSTRKYGSKPVYAYEWLRYHTSNSLLADNQVKPELVEAMAILPFFSGAKGIVLWGWEPQINVIGKHPYMQLEFFVNSLKRIETLTSFIEVGNLIFDNQISDLWNSKLPIIRRIEKSDNECLIMAVDPWERKDLTKSLITRCGNREIKININGNHISLIKSKNGNLKYF